MARNSRSRLPYPRAPLETLRLYFADPDEFEGGRRQRIFAGDKDLGAFEKFTDGKWVETSISADQTAEGKIPIRIVNLSERSNAVLSIVEWVGAR